MEKDIVILIADDDEGHASLIRRNLERAGIKNEIKHFSDGEKVLGFLNDYKGEVGVNELSMLLLLDIRMPRMDGIEVLKKIKEDKTLKKMPVIMLTTTDDPREVNLCHELGCSSYVTKPVDYEQFIGVIRQLGLFLKIVRVPKLARH